MVTLICPLSDLSARFATAGNDLKTSSREAGKAILILVRTFGQTQAALPHFGQTRGGVPHSQGDLRHFGQTGGVAHWHGDLPHFGQVVGGGVISTGTAAGTMRKPPSRSISSSVIVRFCATLERSTWNLPSCPSVGLPVVYANRPSETPRRMARFSTSPELIRGGSRKPKNASRTSFVLTPNLGASPAASGSPSFTRSAILRGCSVP